MFTFLSDAFGYMARGTRQFDIVSDVTRLNPKTMKS